MAFAPPEWMDIDHHVIDGDVTVYVRDAMLRGITSQEWWLVVADAPVAFMKTLLLPADGGHQFTLCDIEVRAQYRRQGWSRRLIHLAETHTGLPALTTGGCTPLGSAAMRWVQLLPGHEWRQVYDPMHFVDDWESLRARYPI